MKKTALALCAALASSAASADFIGFDASAGIWKPAYSGSVGVDKFNADEFSLAKDNVTFLQLAFEHPIPLLPNIMLAHSRVGTEGAADLETDITFRDETFSAGTRVSTDLDLTHTDATLYYELLDNWVNLDLGLTARRYAGDMKVSSEGLSENIRLNGYLPMLYGMARFDLPFTGWSIIAQGNATGYKGDTHTDFTAKVRWDFMPVVDLGLEAGYRMMSLDLKELDDLQSDLEIKGPYIGLNLHL